MMMMALRLCMVVFLVDGLLSGFYSQLTLVQGYVDQEARSLRVAPLYVQEEGGVETDAFPSWVVGWSRKTLDHHSQTIFVKK